MAKKKEPKEIAEVSFKDPNEVIDLPRIGLHLTAENLTVKRYQYLVSLVPDYEKHFNLKYKPKENEQSEMESKK